MKNTKAKTDESSITITLAVAAESPLPIAPVNGLIKPIMITRVSTTAMCAIILFSFFTPLYDSSSNTPMITGISAVNDGVSEPKYPHRPNTMRIMELIRLAVCAFIFLLIRTALNKVCL